VIYESRLFYIDEELRIFACVATRESVVYIVNEDESVYCSPDADSHRNELGLVSATNTDDLPEDIKTAVHDVLRVASNSLQLDAYLDARQDALYEMMADGAYIGYIAHPTNVWDPIPRLIITPHDASAPKDAVAIPALFFAQMAFSYRDSAPNNPRFSFVVGG